MDNVIVACAVGAEKNNGCMARLFAVADESRRLEAIHVRHFNIENDHRDIVSQEKLKSLRAGGSPYKVLVKTLQNALECKEVLTPVVNEQDVDFLFVQDSRIVTEREKISSSLGKIRSGSGVLLARAIELRFDDLVVTAWAHAVAE